MSFTKGKPRASNLVVRALGEARVGERAGAVRGDPPDLVVAVRAGDGALALQVPVRSHRCANGRARSDAAAAEAIKYYRGKNPDQSRLQNHRQTDRQTGKQSSPAIGLVMDTKLVRGTLGSGPTPRIMKIQVC